MLIAISVKGLPAGEHALHVHAVGKCEPPFTSAGGHFNPDSKKHGLMAMEGHHAGDMPNLHIPASGDLAVEVLNTAVTLEKGSRSLFGPTAPRSSSTPIRTTTRPTRPAKRAGRIACGVVQE